ncbi:Glucuronosyltransferase [Aphelenchoides bicaudatus]|nr:Glucuronosyltransferase [Aphelenchoides bicaudatus]
MRLLYFLFLFFALPIGAFKILIYQTILSQSHLHFSGVLTDVLTERGHTVDNLLMEWNPRVIGNGTNKARRIIRVREKNVTAFERTQQSANKMHKMDLPLSHKCFQDTRLNLCKALLSERPMIEELKNVKYDVGLATMHDSCGFGIFKLIDIPTTVGYSPTAEGFGMRDLFGIPTPPSFVPDVEDPEIQGDQLTFFQRIKTFYRSLRSEGKMSQLNKPMKKLFREYYPEFPSVNDLERNMTFVLVNSHEVLNVPKPTSAKVKHIGGIAVQKPKPSQKVSPGIEKVLARSPAGVVLLSFGTYSKNLLTLKVKREIASSFKHFPQYTFLWNSEDPDEDLSFYNQMPNLYRSKSLPIDRLIFDNRVKAFISNGGQQSYMEASVAGVPQLIIPQFADQFYTAACVERNGQGLRLSKSNVTEKSMTGALTEMLYNKKYEKQSRRLSLIMQNYPEQPRDTLIKYVELAAQYPELGQHLQLASARMNWFHYSSADVILFLIFGLIALVALTILIFQLPRYLIDKSKERDYSYKQPRRHDEHSRHGTEAREVPPARKESIHKEITHVENAPNKPLEETPVHETEKDKDI